MREQRTRAYRRIKSPRRERQNKTPGATNGNVMATASEENDDQRFCLRWNNFQSNILSQFEVLRCDEDFTDVTIACGGRRVRAHKIILSACSPYFKELFKDNPCSHPIIFMRDVEVQHVAALMEFMYAGEVNISQDNLSAFLKIADSLKIRGLSDISPDRKTGNVAPDDGRMETDGQCDVLDKESPADEVKAGFFNDQTAEHEWDVKIKGEPVDFGNDGNTGEYAAPSRCSQKFEGDEFRIRQQLRSIKKGYIQERFSSGREARRLHSLDPRPCDECGKVYSNLSNLRQHVKLIHHPTYVSCHNCHKQFKTDLYLRRHALIAHGYMNGRGVASCVTSCGDASGARQVTNCRYKGPGGGGGVAATSRPLDGRDATYLKLSY